jgi:hypothetical protein
MDGPGCGTAVGRIGRKSETAGRDAASAAILLRLSKTGTAERAAEPPRGATDAPSDSRAEISAAQAALV